MSTVSEPNHSTLLRQKVFQIERLGAMPQVVWRLVEALANDLTTPAKLEELIESDPALASKILSLANSAYYGQAQPVTTIRRAIMVMGFQELQILALGAGLAEVFDPKKSQESGGDALWAHCLAVAWAARELALAVEYPMPSEIMIGGLLHDLGKLVLATHLAEDYGRLLNLVQRGVPYYAAERNLGLEHHVIGYWLAKRWGLPAIHETIIRYHHGPVPSEPYYIPTCLIAVADHLVRGMRIGLVHTALPLEREAALNATGLTRSDLNEVADLVKSEVPKVIEAWQRMQDGLS